MFLTLLHTNTIKYTQSSIMTRKEQPPARKLAFSVCWNSWGSAFYFQLTKYVYCFMLQVPNDVAFRLRCSPELRRFTQHRVPGNYSSEDKQWLRI